MDIEFKRAKNAPVLALGAESAGNFSVFNKGRIHLSDDFGDLLDEANFKKFKTAVSRYLKEKNIRPKSVLTDMHPLYKTTAWGAELAKKFGAEHVQVQHHLAHIFSTMGESITHLDIGCPSGLGHWMSKWNRPAVVFGIACDGTGYGFDGKIWGGEVFQVKSEKLKVKSVERIGHLENQIMIGGDLAIREPARMLISILAKFLDKEGVYKFVKRYYTRNQFELLYSQMKQGFNCQETSSTGRVLDAVSVLLGFSGNERKYKHAPIALLEKNSGKPYAGPKPEITRTEKGGENPGIEYCLLTTPLFEYLVKNLNKDKRRLAAAAQLYPARGLHEIVRSAADGKNPAVFFSGGMANNKIMADYFASEGAFMNEKIPRGDAGLSFGQIICHLPPEIQ